MIFKSATQPFCHWCGKKLAKHTTRVSVQEGPSYFDRPSDWHSYVYIGKGNRLRSKAECLPYTNKQIVSIDYSSADYGSGIEIRYVSSFNVWDGESYVDQFFCTNTCAQNMGRAMAMRGWASPACLDARLKAKQPITGGKERAA